MFKKCLCIKSLHTDSFTVQTEVTGDSEAQMSRHRQTPSRMRIWTVWAPSAPPWTLGGVTVCPGRKSSPHVGGDVKREANEQHKTSQETSPSLPVPTAVLPQSAGVPGAGPSTPCALHRGCGSADIHSQIIVRRMWAGGRKVGPLSPTTKSAAEKQN